MALAYITGILPIKKIQDESALNNFEEFTMINSTPITQYYGFTEEEVKELCKQYDMDFETIKAWYNGYLIDGIHMYNPNSVSMSIIKHQLDSYWKNTSSFASINTLLIHLGYLGYDAERKKAFIPNYEVATAFESALETGEWKEIAKAISICDELLDETIEGNANRVAEWRE